jgi:hypothetical protein
MNIFQPNWKFFNQIQANNAILPYFMVRFKTFLLSGGRGRPVQTGRGRQNTTSVGGSRGNSGDWNPWDLLESWQEWWQLFNIFCSMRKMKTTCQTVLLNLWYSCHCQVDRADQNPQTTSPWWNTVNVNRIPQGMQGVVEHCRIGEFNNLFWHVVCLHNVPREHFSLIWPSSCNIYLIHSQRQDRKNALGVAISKYSGAGTHTTQTPKMCFQCSNARTSPLRNPMFVLLVMPVHPKHIHGLFLTRKYPSLHEIRARHVR